LRAPAAAGLAALALAGCGGSGGAGVASTAPAPAAARAASARRAKRSARPALCRGLKARIAGHVATSAANELSGLVLSRTQPGVLWTENDSGNPNHVFAVRADGSLLADVTVSGSQNVDWEDIALGRLPGGGAALLLADIGDNLAQRAFISVYRVPEPHVAGAAGGQIATPPAVRIDLRYPDGPRDAETLLIDPASGAFVVVSKSFGGRSGIYVAQRPAPGAPITMRRSGGLSLGVGEAVTGGDVSADGRTIALRTYDRVYVWRRRSGESVAAALRHRSCSPPDDLLGEGQGEALGLTRDGGAFYTVPEGRRPAIRRYAPG
jgi:hypothetical protein